MAVPQVLLKIPGLYSAVIHFPGSLIRSGRPTAIVETAYIRGLCDPFDGDFEWILSQVDQIQLIGKGHQLEVDVPRLQQLTDFELSDIESFTGEDRVRMRETYVKKKRQW